MGKNIGEYDEMRAKLHLIELRDQGKSVKIGGEDIIVESVKNDSFECDSIPKGINLFRMTDPAIEELAKQVGAFKAPTGSKADVFLNDIGISVKSLRGNPPAFLNHTHRAGFLKVCRRIGASIDELDEIIDDYWNKRLAGVIMEDVKNDDPNSPFKDHLNYLRPILNYFLFTGSGRGDSPYPAAYILDLVDPLRESTWKFSKDEYLTDNWEHIIFSVRSKGMPDSYPSGADAALIEPWVRWRDDSYKGSLHGRAKL